MNFKEFEKELKDIKFKSKNEWEIFLPFNTEQKTIQSVIDISKHHMLINWHVIFTDPTDKKPEPDIRIYWDQNKSKNAT